MDQAIQRAGGDVGNKGVETAEAVIHVLLLVKEIQQMTTGKCGRVFDCLFRTACQTAKAICSATFSWRPRSFRLVEAVHGRDKLGPPAIRLGATGFQTPVDAHQHFVTMFQFQSHA